MVAACYSWLLAGCLPEEPCPKTTTLDTAMSDQPCPKQGASAAFAQMSAAAVELLDLAAGYRARGFLPFLRPRDVIRLGRVGRAFQTASVKELDARAAAAVAGRPYGLPSASIHEAAELCDPEALHLFLRGGASIERIDSYEVRPLHYAAEHDLRGTCVRILLAAGCDIHARYKGWNIRENFRPLHFAAFGGNAVGASLLLAARADANSLARDRTPLFFAEQCRRAGAKETIAVIRRYGGLEKVNIIFDDAWAGADATVGLAEGPGDENQQNVETLNPLIY
eukprot:gnl/TRDRNA2_/TRDRNA2_195492_c0_seq1.p1 gnl/TRDRNA2_/TRDRNA2_195492_c0~~gnl/TRDRNA2_/TRDRNA2_195492_c0_seq1.p1  ORF type:complete len:281 (+),score=47.59 gnl/TRDRNA2_/TRDRNA2_195492_c0_seq1:80-922(+)